MKVIALVCLLVACASAVQMKRPMSHAQIQKYETMKQGNQWASIMMNLAELHIQAGGPLDQLVDAIESVIEDIERKTERSHNEYDTKESEHQAEVSRINSQISSANEDISSTTDFLENVLYVQKKSLEEEIANLTESIANNQLYIQEQTTMRENQHASFNTVVIEHTEALAAVQEALQVLSQLQDGSSLIQVKRAKKSLENVQSKITKSIDGAMVKALLALTAGEFADSGAIQKVADLLNEVANNLTASVAKFTEEETQAQAAFEGDMAYKSAEINRMSMEITEKTEQLNQTNTSIADNEEFLEQRKRDLVSHEKDLVDENENFVRITAIYEDLIAQLASEGRACNEALDVLNNADIAGYIGGRMEQDVIIDQAHGQQIDVESKFSEFQ